MSIIYFKAPSGDEFLQNYALNLLVEKIGQKYGTYGNTNRNKGLKYIIDGIDGSSCRHIKKMFEMSKTKWTDITVGDRYHYKMHKKNYSTYVNKIISLVAKDAELFSYMKLCFNKLGLTNNERTCYCVFWNDAYSALRGIIDNDRPDSEIASAIITNIEDFEF